MGTSMPRIERMHTIVNRVRLLFRDVPFAATDEGAKAKERIVSHLTKSIYAYECKVVEKQTIIEKMEQATRTIIMKHKEDMHKLETHLFTATTLMQSKNNQCRILVQQRKVWEAQLSSELFGGRNNPISHLAAPSPPKPAKQPGIKRALRKAKAASAVAMADARLERRKRRAAEKKGPNLW